MLSSRPVYFAVQSGTHWYFGSTVLAPGAAKAAEAPQAAFPRCDFVTEKQRKRDDTCTMAGHTLYET